MAGGPSTPALAIAVSDAGGLGFLAAGYKRADAVATRCGRCGPHTSAPFGVNVFVPTPAPADPRPCAATSSGSVAEAERQGAELGEPRFEDDDYEAKLEAVYEERPAVVSFTFGCPDPAVVDRLHGAEIAVWVTVTNAAEALAARDGRRGRAGRAGQRGRRSSRRVRRRRVRRRRSRAARAAAAPRRARRRSRWSAAGGIADGAALAAVLCAGASRRPDRHSADARARGRNPGGAAQSARRAPADAR